MTDISYCGDGSLLASSSDDRSIIIWDSLTGAQMKTLVLANATSNVVFSQEGRNVIYSCNDDHSIYTWDTSASSSDIVTLAGHSTYIASLCVPYGGDGGYVL